MPTEIIAALIGAAAVIIAAVIGLIKKSNNSQNIKGDKNIQVMSIEENHSKDKRE